jgi:formyl-CoA transferase
MVVELDHPVEGPVRALGIPVKLSDTAASIRRTPPDLGEHTDELLRAVGYTAAEIDALRAEGAVA